MTEELKTETDQEANKHLENPKPLISKDVAFKILIVAVFLFAPYYVLKPLFAYETWPTGHDSNGTIFNAWTMIKALRENFHLPLIWQPENCGYKGNPYWAFYQPISYFVVYLVSLIASVFDYDYVYSSLKGAVYISFLISEITMFILLREIFKDSENKNTFCLFGSIIYLLSPYRFIDLYSRNAYSELWVFPWMPIYLLGFYKLVFKKDISGAYFIAIGMPLLFLSHLMPSFFFVSILNIALILYLLFKKEFKSFFTNKKLASAYVFSNIAGGLISCLYVLPAMGVIKYLNGDITGFDRVNIETVMKHIPWVFDMLDIKNFNGPWQVGQLFLVSFAILTIVILMNKKNNHQGLLQFLFIAMVITFGLLMSKTFWTHAPKQLYTLQFPWRLFLIYSCFCTIILSVLVKEFKVAIPLLALLVAFHFHTGKRFLKYGGEEVVIKHYDTESWINVLYKNHFTTTNNYAPHSILPKTTDPILFNFRHADVLGQNEKEPNTYLVNQKPGVNILSHFHKGNVYTYNLQLDSPAFLTFKQYYYPTWKLKIDSKKEELYFTEKGFIGFEVPEGKHKVEISTN